MKCPEKSAKKRKSGGLKEICNGSEADADFVEDKPLKSVGELEAPEQDEQGLKAITKRKLHVLKDDCTKEEEKPVVTTDGGCTKGAWASDAVREVDGKILAASVPKNCDRNLHRKELPAEVPLPSGTLLTTVAGVDLPVEAVGEALQFLEFCAAFGKVSISFKLVCHKVLHPLVSISLLELSILLLDVGSISHNCMTSCSR